MCLSTVWTEEKKKKYLKSRPKEFTVYKVARKYKTRYGPLLYHERTRFHAGINHANTQCRISVWSEERNYSSGYHLFTKLRDAKQWNPCTGTIIPCRVKREWVTSIGSQRVREGRCIDIVIVASQITCPDYIGKKG